MREHLSRCRRWQPEAMDRWSLAIPDTGPAGTVDNSDPYNKDGSWEAAASTPAADPRRPELVAKLSNYFARATARKTAASMGLQSAKVAEARRIWDEDMVQVRDEAQRNREQAAARRHDLEASSRARSVERRPTPGADAASGSAAPHSPRYLGLRASSPESGISANRPAGGLSGGLFRGAVPGAPRDKKSAVAVVDGLPPRAAAGPSTEIAGAGRLARQGSREDLAASGRRGLRTAPAPAAHLRDGEGAQTQSGRHRPNHTLPALGGGGASADSDSRWKKFFGGGPTSSGLSGEVVSSGDGSGGGVVRSLGPGKRAAAGGSGRDPQLRAPTRISGDPNRSAASPYADLLQDDEAQARTATAPTAGGSRRQLLPSPSPAAGVGRASAASAVGADGFGSWAPFPAAGSREAVIPQRPGDERAPSGDAGAWAGRMLQGGRQGSPRDSGGNGKSRDRSPSPVQELAGLRGMSFVDGRGTLADAMPGPLLRARSYMDGRPRSGSLVPLSAERMRESAAQAQAHVDTVHKSDRLLHEVRSPRQGSAKAQGLTNPIALRAETVRKL